MLPIASKTGVIVVFFTMPFFVGVAPSPVFVGPLAVVVVAVVGPFILVMVVDVVVVTSLVR